MNRLKYIYWLAVLMILLSCGRMLTDFLGTGWLLWLIVAPIILMTWGVVWIRLFGLNNMRPEFAILTIMPQSIYFMAKSADTELMHQPVWQNVYVVLWVLFCIIIIMSLRPEHKSDKKMPLAKDQIFIMMSILTVIYAVTTMASYAAEICY